ncbi:MAG: hypothetical protein ACXVEF_14065 [Polyangiales bacterium]
MSRVIKLVSALALPAVLVGIGLVVMPAIHVGPGAADAITFALGALIAMSSLALGARVSLSEKGAFAVDFAAVVALTILAVLRVRSPWMAPVVDAALLAFAWATGAAIGRRIEHAGHLLPAIFVAAAADLASVASSWGPSKAIVANERALSLLAISAPVPGVRAAAPVLGVGDLIFVALVLGTVDAKKLRYGRAVSLALVGIAIAGFASARLGAAVPALPAIGALLLLGLPQIRKVTRKDRTVTTIAIGVSIVVAIWTTVSALRSR